mgnify:CR=1 FL=1
MLREYIVSEAMHALGVPTTRALAAVSTGATVHRQEALPGAVLTRVAASHIRVGTFEFFAARQDTEALAALVEHVLARHYPGADAEDHPALTLLGGAIERQAQLIAKWQLLGFIHGVMNTDNCLVSGETIDYGPCAFMEGFDPATVFSSIDRKGRYAYGNQPRIAAWNLTSLAQALMPLLAQQDDESLLQQRAQDLLESFEPQFHQAYWQGLRAKLGLQVDSDDDDALLQEFLALLSETRSDFTLSFRHLADLADASLPQEQKVPFSFAPAFDPWLSSWRKRLALESRPASAIQRAMHAISPALIPRNHLVEEAIDRATHDEHFCAFHDLVDALRKPFAYDSSLKAFVTPARPEQVVSQTFCGT